MTLNTRIYTWFSLLIFTLLMSDAAFGTHNRAGEIVFKRVNSNPFLYEISVITYTKTGGDSDNADRCQLMVDFGDGTRQNVLRVNGAAGCPNTPGARRGELIPNTNTRYNVYTTQHLYPGPGTYKISMEDPMRNAGVVNIKDSDSVPFYIESYLTIDVTTGGNTAPTLRNPPIDNGCVNVPFYHNPGAVDPEGDSLVYSLVGSKSYNGEPIGGYVLPDQIEPGFNNKISIDSVSGTLTWNSPQTQGEYNVAILIEEYRKNPSSGLSYKVGAILRDMQIDIAVCMNNNNPPFITLNEETCVTAGDSITEIITADDLEDDFLTLSVVGAPLDPGFGGSATPSTQVSGEPELTMQFGWRPSCEEVRQSPYWLYFKAKENVTPVQLVDFKTMRIKVNSPAVEITSVEPQGKALRLNWTKAVCDKAIGYDIYRYNDSLAYVADNCVTGIPESSGYQLVGKVNNINSTTFLDNNNGNGLVHGQRYCYMVVTRFFDGDESYPSIESCGLLIRDVPILNRVSVVVTDSEQGVDSIAWFSPTDLRFDIYPGPYRYRLLRSASANGPFQEVYLSDPNSDVFALDTVFVDSMLNTVENQYFYQIEILSGESMETPGAAKSASSIFLTSTPSDNQLTLDWSVDVPWTNHQFLVYRFSNHEDSLNVMRLLDSTTVTSYIDTRLANLREYRYLIKSIGNYSALEINDTLVNYSQIHTGIPIDNVPPCIPPNQLILGDCDLDQTTIEWSNPNETCEGTDDVVSYKILFNASLGAPLTLLEEIDDPATTEYFRQSEGTIAGCYAVVAVDSFGNESALDQPLCIDNCPVYELPNVFTPGTDGLNDFFEPFPYRYIESIQLYVYNRWGIEVFSTTDPAIRWDGTDQRSGLPLPDGVYFYLCQVNEIRLQGIESRELKGDLHLIREFNSETLAP